MGKPLKRLQFVGGKAGGEGKDGDEGGSVGGQGGGVEGRGDGVARGLAAANLEKARAEGAANGGQRTAVGEVAAAVE